VWWRNKVQPVNNRELVGNKRELGCRVVNFVPSRTLLVFSSGSNQRTGSNLGMSARCVSFRSEKKQGIRAYSYSLSSRNCPRACSDTSIPVSSFLQ